MRTALLHLYGRGSAIGGGGGKALPRSTEILGPVSNPSRFRLRPAPPGAVTVCDSTSKNKEIKRDRKKIREIRKVREGSTGRRIEEGEEGERKKKTAGRGGCERRQIGRERGCDSENASQW